MIRWVTRQTRTRHVWTAVSCAFAAGLGVALVPQGLSPGRDPAREIEYWGVGIWSLYVVVLALAGLLHARRATSEPDTGD